MQTTVLVWILIVALALYSMANLPLWWMTETSYGPSVVAAILSLALVVMMLTGRIA